MVLQGISLGVPPVTLPLKPFGHHVVLSLLPEPPKSNRLIVQAPVSLTRRAMVQAVGGLVQTVKVGETVLCRANMGSSWGDEDTVVMKEESILCRLDT